uniref:ABC transmembrane type-1 domain-containing protein n=1 Tax=Panagrolaimus sp. PS1159 TaxID=55785 RepID=A0AC35GRF7_9BILA
MDKEPISPPKRFNHDHKFGLRFFKSIPALFPLFYPTWEWAFLFTFVIMSLNALSEWLTNRIGLYPGQMYGVLLAKDYHEFWHIFIKGTFMYIAKTGCLAIITFVSWLLYVSFRRNVVSSLQRRYFRNNIYYRINCVDGEGIDNPDQRITQDVERVCDRLAVNIIPIFLSGPFVIAYYTYKTYQTAELLGVGIIYGYFIIGSIINKFLISPLSKWSARVEKSEGDFRFEWFMNL